MEKGKQGRIFTGQCDSLRRTESPMNLLVSIVSENDLEKLQLITKSTGPMHHSGKHGLLVR
jgi:hypothetical protein